MSRGNVDHRVDLRFAATYAAMAVVVLGGTAWWIWSVRDRLPDPIARHWSGGTADGFSELPAILAMVTVLPVLVSLPLALVAFVARSPLAPRRTLGATAPFLVVLIVVLVVDSIRLQLDLADVSDAPPPDLGGLVGLALGALVVLVGIVGRFQIVSDDGGLTVRTLDEADDAAATLNTLADQRSAAAG